MKTGGPLTTEHSFMRTWSPCAILPFVGRGILASAQLFRRHQERHPTPSAYNNCCVYLLMYVIIIHIFVCLVVCLFVL